LVNRRNPGLEGCWVRVLESWKSVQHPASWEAQVRSRGAARFVVGIRESNCRWTKSLDTMELIVRSGREAEGRL
jgi:hypothetical protein